MSITKVGTQTQGAPAAGAYTATLPTAGGYAAGDLLVHVLLCKYEDTSAHTINQGWSARTPTGTGGFEGPSIGHGQHFGQVFTKVATSGSETAPTVTPGATAANTRIWYTFALRKTNADWVTFEIVWGSDVDTAAPLGGTIDFAATPTAGDAILGMWGSPTATGTNTPTYTLSATGLSGGTVAGSPSGESTVGDDMSAGVAWWTGFTGTASSDLTATVSLSGNTNQSGIFGAILVRDGTLADFTGTAALAATDAVTSAGAVGKETGASRAQTSTITTAGNVGKVAGAALAAVATIAAAGVVGTSSGADVSGSATISAAGDITAAGEGAASLDATATITAAGLVASSGAASLDETAAVAAAGAVGASSGAALSATSTITAAGAPGVASGASVSATATVTAAGAITTPGTSGALVTATVSITAAGVVVSYDTDTSNDDDGVYLGDGYAEVAWDPGVVPIPNVFGPLPAEFYTSARVVDTAPVDGAPATSRVLSIPAAIDRVLINNVDFTFYGGAAAIVEGFKLIDPLLYGSASVMLPAINPRFPSDLGNLYDYFVDATVRIQRVLDGEVIAVDHKGFVSRIDTSGTQLRLEVDGQAAGSLANLPVTAPVYRRKQDVEHILVDLLRDARVQAKEHDGLSGVGLIKRGGADGLSIFNETLAVWAGSSGQAITFTPNADGIYRKTQKPGTEDPADFTCYPSDLVEISLAQDLTGQYTEVIAQGWTAAGELVTNIKTPGLTQGVAPAFPSVDPLGMGDTDADTTNGAGVTQIQEQLALHNFSDPDDLTPGVYDLQLDVDVRDFQKFAGLNVTGQVGENAWAALWDLDSLGYSLDDAREYPMAQDIRTVKWLRTANGSKRAANPLYDPHVRRKGVFIDVGGPFKKSEIRDFAASKLAAEGGVWSGQIVLRSGVVAGVHNPGDTFTTADVMDRRDVLPNMRAWLPWEGPEGTTVYVTGVDHAGETTTLLVSTLPESTMETWEALERRKDSQSNPGRSWSGSTRASQVRNDKGPQWDTTSGWIANKVALVAGWNEVEVPAGQAGIVKRIRLQLEDPAEFAVIGPSIKPLSTEALDNNPHTGTPLTDPRPANRPWWEQQSVRDWFDSRGTFKGWGTANQPCGYDPSLKNDERGATASPMTGLFLEEAGFDYETGSEPVLFMYVWVGNANNLLSGRVLKNQRTTDF